MVLRMSTLPLVKLVLEAEKVRVLDLDMTSGNGNERRDANYT